MSKKTANNIRKGLLVAWIVLTAVLMIYIRYAVVHVDAQALVTKLVYGYICSTPIVVAMTAYLKKKE